jgi:formate dehydrogenase major subunit
MQRNLSQRKVTEEEQVKQAGLFLDFDEIVKRGAMSKEEVLIAKWYGIYRSRQAGDHMARIVIPGGRMTAAHAKAIAALADKYAAGKVSFTTRQSAQYHRLQLADLPAMLRDLRAVGLTTFHGCGDVARNVAACPWASTCPHRRLDVLPYAQKTAKLLSDSRDLDNLPRKYKVTFSGCQANCGQPYINCLGAIGVVRKKPDGTEETGFQVVIGGGMGWKPFVAQPLYTFVPADAIMQISRAVGLLFSEQGDRTSRKYARLKFVVDRLGIDRCRELLQAIYQREGIDASAFETQPVEDCGPAIPPRPLRDPDPVDDDGKQIQRIMIPKGEIAASHLRRIGELAELYADGYVYSTNRQNLELHGVDPAKRPLLGDALQALGLAAEGFYGLTDIVTCVGTTYCPLAVTRTHDMFDRLDRIVKQAKYDPIRDKILINITGCPNSCAQYYIADIGLRGRRIREHSGSVEGYEIRVGGTQTAFGQIIGDFKIDDCETVVTCILDTFLSACGETQVDSLAAHVREHGIGLYQKQIDTLNIQYTKSPNPLEYTADTGLVSGSTDLNVIGKDVPCQDACPAKTNVPEYIRLIKEGRYDEAHRINQEDNVLPGVLGRICTHPCQDDCRHHWTNTQGPVRICSLKRAATDMKTPEQVPLDMYFEPTGKRTAVIGAGPAGLAAARELKRYGHAVTLYEKLPYPGGQVRMGVPEFRLPRAVLDADIQAVLDTGIEVKYNQPLDSTQIGRLCEQYDAVLLAAGANVPRTVRLDGLAEGTAIEGLHFMKRFNESQPFEPITGPVVIIGGGFTAVDCARSMRRLSPEASVAIMYRRSREQMAATEQEFEQMEQEGVAIQTHVTPVSAEVQDGQLQALTFVRNQLGEPDASGKPSFTKIDGSEFTVPCRMLILAIGQTPEKTLLPAEIHIVDAHCTSCDALFVAGDFAMGNGDVIHAVADGKSAAERIDRYLTGQVRRKPAVRIESAETTGRLRDYDLLEPVSMAVLPLEQRDRCQEVELGFSVLQANTHAKRCYFCNYKFEIDQDKCIHCDWCIRVSPRACIHRVRALAYDPHTSRAAYEVVDASVPEEANYIWIDSDQCIRCGNCYDICPVDAITLRKADRCIEPC